MHLVLRSETISRQTKRIQNEGIFIGYYFLTHKKRRGEGGARGTGEGNGEGSSEGRAGSKEGRGQSGGRQTLHKTFLNPQYRCAAGAGGFF